METSSINDLMVSLKEYASVPEDASLNEAIEELERIREKVTWRRFKHRAVLVKDKQDKIVGKVRPIEVIDNLEPGYRKLGDVGHTGRSNLSAEKIRGMIQDHKLWQQPLDEICRQASGIAVKEIMHSFTESEYIPIDSPLETAIHQMIIGRHMSLLVTDNGKVVGVLRLTDIYTEICQIIKESSPDL